jgi:AraC-like DNA-binding protein
MGLRPEGMTLDRINNSVGYEPTNCRWATKRQQANNTRNNRIISVEGTKKTLAEWARDAGMSDRTLRTRLRLGWEPERALSQPVKVYRPRKR